MHERRSGEPAQRGEDLAAQALAQGVGGRQRPLFDPGGGGGYPDECTSSELQEETKIRELADMGLPAVWMRVVRTIGYDHFLELWRILDAAAEHRELRRSDNESMIEVSLRRYASFRRYQRNRFIETLARTGLSPPEIREAVESRLGEQLSESHVSRQVRRARIVK